MSTTTYTAVPIPIDQLKPHPRNYREHPADQLVQIEQSLKEHGFYRNVVTASDLTILAGHGVVEAARRLGMATVPVIQLPIGPEDSKAIKILIGDNELGHLGERNDRLLADLLKEVQAIDVDGLLGTGYDEMMLANLLFVTRPESEVADFDEAAEWAGMPEHVPQASGPKLVLTFETMEARDAFCRKLNLPISKAQTAGSWYPPKDRQDQAGFKVVEEDGTLESKAQAMADAA
jgi:hypothetical protein